MSYYVTITRKPNPYWKAGPEISEAEWRAVALQEADFRPPTEAEKAEAAPFTSPTDIVWTGHPEHPTVWFDWHQGQIDVNNPDDTILAVMARLAARLGAQLLGEGGERFDVLGKSLGVEDFPEEPGTKRPSWWQRLFTGGTSGG
jgi:hypothetical protein